MAPDQSSRSSGPDLEHKHTEAAIRERLTAATDHNYLGDFVLGAVDGTITTFAVVSGAAGANFSNAVALVLGVANLFADGFSMAVSNYLSVQTQRHLVERVRRMEERHIDLVPDGEREEIRQIFLAKGFKGDSLEHVVDVLTQDRRSWVDTMIKEEFGLSVDTPSPGKSALATFTAFFVAGAIPLLPLLVPGLAPKTMFVASSTCTVVAFILIGVAKGAVLRRSLVRSCWETLGVGIAAAWLAFMVGWLLRGIAAGL